VISVTLLFSSLLRNCSNFGMRSDYGYFMLIYLSYQLKAENFDNYSSGKQILSFYGIGMFMKAFRKVDAGTSQLNQSTSSHPIPHRSILILSCHLNPENFLTS
jgi:hypothetical protein